MRPIRKLATVQGGNYLDLPSGDVPWAVHMLALREYSRHHDQIGERLAERGGFDWAELIACLRGDYSPEGVAEAREDLRRAALSEASGVATPGTI